MFMQCFSTFCIKKGMYNTAAIFMNETTVPQTPTYPKCLDLELDSLDGFLHEWWSDAQSFSKVSRLTNTPMDDSSTFRIP